MCTCVSPYMRFQVMTCSKGFSTAIVITPEKEKKILKIKGKHKVKNIKGWISSPSYAPLPPLSLYEKRESVSIHKKTFKCTKRVSSLCTEVPSSSSRSKLNLLRQRKCSPEWLLPSVCANVLPQVTEGGKVLCASL